MINFKVGDRVKFIKEAHPSIFNPDLGSIWTILKIESGRYDPENLHFYWGVDYAQYFYACEIILANSELVKEKLGIN